MKCKRTIARALLIALLIAAFATGCSGNLRERLAGGFALTEKPGISQEAVETGVTGSGKESTEFETEPETNSQDTEPDSLSAEQPTAKSPVVSSTGESHETAQTPESELSGGLPERTQTSEPTTSGQTAAPEVTWPVLPPTPTISVAPVIPVESITLSAYEITIDKRSEYKIGHTVFPENATDKTVSYISSNRAVATVTNDGVIYAEGAGSAVIQCVSASGKISASCSVNVVVPVTNLSLSTKKSIYRTDEICSYSISVFPEDATDKTYSVSIDNADAADFDDESVYFISSGSVTITVTSANGVTASKEIIIVNLAELAEEVFRLTNVERQNYGLSSFSQNNTLTLTAIVRAKESVIFFSHTRPDGSDCFTAFDDNGVIYGMAAENIAYGQRTPAEVVAGWMESPGHRANILNSGLGYLGVGVEMDENGRLYWSQEFTD